MKVVDDTSTLVNKLLTIDTPVKSVELLKPWAAKDTEAYPLQPCVFVVILECIFF